MTPTLSFPKQQMFFMVPFLLCAIVLCLFGADSSFASEQYVTAYSGSSEPRSFAANVIIALVIFALLPAILFCFSFPTHMKLVALPKWKIRGEMAKVIRPTKDTRKKLLMIFLITMGATFTGPFLGPIPSRIGLTETDALTLNLYMVIFILATALFSAIFVAQSAHALIFSDGKIWYKTHMKLRYRSFNVSDIEFVEENTVGKFNLSTFYLKEGTHTRLFWLFFPPELKEYLVEQGVSIVAKSGGKNTHE